MEYHILTGENFESESFLSEVMEVEKACYENPEYWGKIENMEARYLQNKRTFVCVMDSENNLVGHINFFPVKEELWQEIVETGDKIRDDDIKPEELAEYSKEKPNKLFIISVVIHPDHRGKGVIRMLTDGFIKYLNDLQDEGYKIEAISATAVSPDGQKFLSSRMFGLHRELPDGNKVYVCKGAYLKKLLANDLYFKTYQSDSYLFLPYADHEKNTLIDQIFEPDFKKSRKLPKIVKCLLDELDDCLRYEYESDLVDELKRVYLGKFYLMHTLDESYDNEDVQNDDDDEYGEYDEDGEDEEDEDYEDDGEEEEKRPHIVGEERVYLTLLAHHRTNMYILTLFLPDSKYSSSQLEDQMCQRFLQIRKKKDKDENGFYQYQNINDYMKENYGLLPCGKGKSFLCMSNKPKSQKYERELTNILSAEAYNSMRQDFHIQYQDLSDKAEKSRAVYSYYNAYMTENVVAFLLHDYKNLKLKDRISVTATYLFIIELVTFQNIALNKLTKKISDAFLVEGDVSYAYISKLYKDYAKTIKFWQTNNFRYYGTQKEAEQIHEAFENDELQQHYREQQEFLENMLEVENAQAERRNDIIINFAATILAVLQVEEYLVGLLEGFYNYFQKFKIIVNPADAAADTFKTLVLGGSGLFLLVMYILNKKRKFLQNQKLSELTGGKQS